MTIILELRDDLVALREDLAACRADAETTRVALQAAMRVADELQAENVRLRDALECMLGRNDLRPFTTADVLSCGCDPHIEHCGQCDERRAANARMEPRLVAERALAAAPTEPAASGEEKT